MTTKWNYRKGLHGLGNGACAWLAPDGNWGWSNAGLIVDDGEALLVDTLFDLAMTDEILKAMRDAERIVVNVDRLYGEFSGQPSPPDIQKLFSQMAVIARY